MLYRPESWIRPFSESTYTEHPWVRMVKMGGSREKTTGHLSSRANHGRRMGAHNAATEKRRANHSSAHELQARTVSGRPSAGSAIFYRKSIRPRKRADGGHMTKQFNLESGTLSYL
mmetsp:Transcript_26949/g.63295  ORF Transcript_26949/g.63295 Transcript_26949/m.63295 type:complete len:116 (+) Transcript_26949:1788-2135(+)